MRISKETTTAIFVSILIGIFVLLFNTLNPPIYLYVVFFGLAFLLISRYPLSGLLATVFLTLVFGQQFTLQPLVTEAGQYLIYPLDILLVITALCAFLRRRRWWPENRKEWRWLIPLFNLFILVIAANLVWSLFMGEEFALAFSAFKNYAVYSLIFFLSVVLLRRASDLVQLLRTFLWSGLAAGVILLINLVRQTSYLVAYTPISTSGERYLSGVHALALTFAIITSLAYFAYQQKIWRHFQVPLVVGQTIGLIMAMFRHLWLVVGMVVAILVAWLPLTAKRRLINFGGRALVGLVVIIFIAYYVASFMPNFNMKFAMEDYLQPFIERVTTISLHPEDQSAQYRLQAWGAAWEAFLDNPVFGNGLDAKLTIEVNNYRQNIDARDVHNSFLTILVETGLFGLVPLLLFCAVVIIRGRQILKQARAHQTKLLAFLLCFIAFVCAANFGVYFETNLTVIFFWIFAAGVFVAANLAAPTCRTNKPTNES